MKKITKIVLTIAATLIAGVTLAQDVTTITFEQNGKKSAEGLWFAPTVRDYFILTTEQAAVGESSLKMQYIADKPFEKGLNVKLPGKDKKFNVAAGECTISYKLYLCDGELPEFLLISLYGFDKPIRVKSNLTSLARNQWVDVEHKVKLPADFSDGVTLTFNPANGSDCAMYLDEFSVK